jgi:integrase
MAPDDYSSLSPNQIARAKVYLEPDEVENLEKRATNLRDRLLIRLLFHLGCRVSEALALEVQDIDFSQGTVVIQHLKYRTKLSCQMCGARLGATHVFCPKCGGKIGKSRAEEQQHRRQRILPVDSHTLDILNEYVERGGPVVRDGKRVKVIALLVVRAIHTWSKSQDSLSYTLLPHALETLIGELERWKV